MPDSYVLRFAGTSVEIATFTRAEGVDFGTRDLLRFQHIEAPFDLVSLQQKSAGVRKMAFPLIFRASAPGLNLGLEDAEALLRKLAQPGATIDLKPQGATTATRFNILSGRYEVDYNVHHNREGFRLATLRLDTEPFGYWPTIITLASVASMALPGNITWAGSVIGDAPGLARVIFQPTVASSIAAGSWMHDFIAWSVHSRASYLGLIQAASLGLFAGASLLNDGFAPASQAVRYAASQNQADWFQLTAYQLASALEPALRGRHRAFAWMRVEPSQALPWYVAIDTVPQINPSAALASAQPVATIAPAVASGTPGAFGAQPSPAYTLVDLGEIALPATASGIGGDQRIRLWAAPATSNVGVASPVLLVGALGLLPIDGDAHGVLPRGLAYPSILTPSAGKLIVDATNRQVTINDRALDMGTANPALNGWQHYRGVLPYIATGGRLDAIGATRKTAASGATMPPVHNAPAWTSVSVQYMPRFQFLKGL